MMPFEVEMIAMPRPFMTRGIFSQFDLHALDVPFVDQDLADGLLHVRSRDLHRRVFGTAGVADAGEQVRDRIGDLHATNLLRLACVFGLFAFL